jgi:hypothetical protein
MLWNDETDDLSGSYKIEILEMILFAVLMPILCETMLSYCSSQS